MTAEELRDRILAFLDACRRHRPVIKEGSETMPLDPERFSLEVRQGKLLLEAWDESRSLVRRVIELRKETENEMVLGYRRFGAGESTFRILASAKKAPQLQREAARTRFAGRLLQMLGQQFPGWKVEQLSAELDLEHGFSTKTPRAVLRQAKTAWAVAACSEEDGEEAADGALTQGLAWLDHLRRGSQRAGASRGRLFTGLMLFLPERHFAATALRWPFLNPELAQYQLFVFSRDDSVRRAEALEYGNLATQLPVVEPSHATAQPAPGMLPVSAPFQRLAGLADVQLVRTTGGAACRVRGLDFARLTADGPVFGFGDEWRSLTPENLIEAETLAAEIARFRAADSPDRRHPFYTAQPERWLESLLAADISVLSAELNPACVYSQVPAIAGLHRGVIDLLAATRAGRLVVIELKTASDPNLPMQALDYWMRVKWHFERGDFERHGYFPGVALSKEPPLLWLAAPAFAFHQQNELALRYLCRDIPVRRIGLNESWRESVKVVYRG